MAKHSIPVTVNGAPRSAEVESRLLLVHLLRESSLPDGLHVVSLPDWLARASGEATGLGHPTMLAGLALYDLDAGRASDELLALVRDLTGRAVRVGVPAEAAAVAALRELTRPTMGMRTRASAASSAVSVSPSFSVPTAIATPPR